MAEYHADLESVVSMVDGKFFDKLVRYFPKIHLASVPKTRSAGIYRALSKEELCSIRRYSGRDAPDLPFIIYNI